MDCTAFQCYDLASSVYSCESSTCLIVCPVFQLVYIFGLFIFPFTWSQEHSFYTSGTLDKH